MFGRNLGEVLLGGIMGSWGDDREVVDRESVSFILSKIVVHCLETARQSRSQSPRALA